MLSPEKTQLVSAAERAVISPGIAVVI